MIDWTAPAVLVASRVVMQDGPLEFAACFAGKEHESILRIDADANHVYMALGLIGLTPGRPPRWDEDSQRFEAPTGDLVDVRVVAGVEPKAASLAGAIELFDWIQEGLDPDLAERKSPIPRPWVFAGSRQLPDRPGILAQISGEGVSVVDSPGSLLSLSRRHTSADAALWCSANPGRVPAEKTLVTLVFSPARLRKYEVTLGAAGEVRVNGTRTDVGDLADLISLARRIDRADVQTIQVKPGVREDEKVRFGKSMQQSGLADGSWTFD